MFQKVLLIDYTQKFTKKIVKRLLDMHNVTYREEAMQIVLTSPIPVDVLQEINRLGVNDVTNQVN